MVVVGRRARVGDDLDLVFLTGGAELFVAGFEPFVELCLLGGFGLCVLVEVDGLLPHLRWAWDGPKRSLNLWRKGAPEDEKAEDGKDRHAEEAPDLADLGLWVVPGGGL